MSGRVLYFTSWYRDKNPERDAEIQLCIHNCIHSPEIDKAYLLSDVLPPIQALLPKAEWIQLDRRPTYQDFFNIANSIAAPGDIIVISNTDIYPDASTKHHLVNNLKENECYALTRWDVLPTGEHQLFDRPDSQDTWCFVAPIKPIHGGDFTQGRGGCDNKIALQIKESGYDVKNPSRSIKFLHLHNTNIRNYTTADIIPGPYHLIHPTYLNQTTSPKYYDF